MQGVCPPAPFARPALVIFAGDHGVARAAGTSAYPPEVTAQMVVNFATGGAAANVLARQVGASVRVVDVSVDTDPAYLEGIDPAVSSRRIRRGCGSIDREDAMTAAECTAALELGRTLAREEIAGGADILIAGDMGIGNTTPAATLIGLLTSTSAADVTGRGTGIDDATLARKTTTVAAAMARGIDVTSDHERLLVRVGQPGHRRHDRLPSGVRGPRSARGPRRDRVVRRRTGREPRRSRSTGLVGGGSPVHRAGGRPGPRGTGTASPSSI